MYKISSLEAGARFKFYGHTFTLGVMEWNTSDPKFPIELLLGSNPTAMGLDVIDCYNVDQKKRYWIVVSTLVLPLEQPNSNLSDLSMANKLDRLERVLDAHNSKIDTLFGHANSLNLAGMVTDIINLQNAVKKITSDRLSFDCVAEIRKLQNAIAEMKSGINANINSDAKIFSEISARLDKLEMLLPESKVSKMASAGYSVDFGMGDELYQKFAKLAKDSIEQYAEAVAHLQPVDNLPKPEYAPGAPEAETDLSKSPQVGWRKIDPNNLPEGQVLVKAIDSKMKTFTDRGIISPLKSGGFELIGLGGFRYHNYTHYIEESDLLNLPEIQ